MSEGASVKRADKAINELCESLGENYVVVRPEYIGKPYLYCDFGNGFGVKVEGVYTVNMRRKASLCLFSGSPWDENSVAVDALRKIRREDIYDTVESFRVFVDDLIDAGYVGDKVQDWWGDRELIEQAESIHRQN